MEKHLNIWVHNELVLFLLVLSLSLNFMTFFSCVIPIVLNLFNDRANKSQKQKNKELYGVPERNICKNYNLSQKISRGVVNLCYSVILFTLGIVLITTTDVLKMPFTYYSNVIIFANALLASLCLYNLFHGLIYVKLNFQNLHITSKLVISLIFIATVTIQHENAIAIVIGLLMCIPIVTNEIRVLCSLKNTNKRKLFYKMLLIINILQFFIWNIILPAILLIVHVLSSFHDFLNTSVISKISIVVVTLFYLIHNAWALRLMAYNAMTEISLSDSMREKHSEFEPVYGLENGFVINPKKKVIVYLRDMSESPTVHFKGRSESTAVSPKTKVCNNWTEIDLSQEF